MTDAEIGSNTIVDKSIIAEKVKVGSSCVLGTGQDVPNKIKPDVYSFGLVTIGEDSIVPDNVQIGKNTAISGVTDISDYPGGILESGETLIKVGEKI